ncbi:hypothetical protein HWV62_30519 [Athelia sp. TMB]|nr:hypothetical protein HWV62_30519 [Athelia sp. TMB]
MPFRRGPNGQFAKAVHIASLPHSPRDSISSFSEVEAPTLDIDSGSDRESDLSHSPSPFPLQTAADYTEEREFINLDTPNSSPPPLSIIFPNPNHTVNPPVNQPRPFVLFPPAAPARPVAPVAPVQNLIPATPARRIMSSNRIEMFYGDGRLSENPQDFVKMLETSFDSDPTLTGAQKCERFRRHCRSALEAEEWYDEQDAATLADWGKLKLAFNIRWPPQPRIKPTKADRTRELRNLILAEGAILEKKDQGGVMVYGFVAWMTEAKRIAALCDTANAQVQSVYDTMPKVLRDLVDENQLTTWTTFGAAVYAAPISKLRDAIKEEERKKAMERRLAELDRRPHAPAPAQSSSTAELQRMLAGLSLGAPAGPRSPTAPAPTVGTPRAARLFATFGQTPATTQYTPAPRQPYRPAYRPAHERLVDLQRTALIRHPNTPAGLAAYATQVAEYVAAHGTQSPHETRPHPLRPGTLDTSTGACFRCGLDIPARHSSRECSSTNPVSDQELRYRMVAAVCYGIIRGPAPPDGRVAQAVRMIEVTNLTDEQLAEMQAGGATITELGQGNGDGLQA